MNKDELIKDLEWRRGEKENFTQDLYSQGCKGAYTVAIDLIRALEIPPVLRWQTGSPPLDLPILYQAGFSGPHRVANFVTDECTVTLWIPLSDVLALIQPPEAPRGFQVTVDCLPLDDQVCDPRCDNLIWAGGLSEGCSRQRCSLFKIALKTGMTNRALRCADCIRAEEKANARDRTEDSQEE